MFGRIFEGTLAISHVLVMFALDGGALRRFRPPPGSRTLRSARSMVAALIESKPAQPPAQVEDDRAVPSHRPGSATTAAAACRTHGPTPPKSRSAPRTLRHNISVARAEAPIADRPDRRGEDASRACGASHSPPRIHPESVPVPSGCSRRNAPTAQPPTRLVSTC